MRIQLNTNVADPTITYSDGGEEWLTFDRRNEFGGKVTLSFTAARTRHIKIVVQKLQSQAHSLLKVSM